MIRLLKQLAVAFATVGLVACGGSSSTSTTASTTTTAAAPSPADYAATYTGTVAGRPQNAEDSGTFTITIDSKGNIEGDSIVKQLPWKLRGTVNANGQVSLGLYSVDLTFHGHNWTGQITKTSGAISGTWEHANGDGVGGTFSGAATSPLPGAGTTTTTTTTTQTQSFAGRYAGGYDSPAKFLCIDPPGLDPTGHGDCGQRYTLAGGIDFTVDANNNLTGSLYVFGPAGSGTICPGTQVQPDGRFEFYICDGAAGGVNGSGTIVNGVMTGRLQEGPHDWKYGEFSIARQ
jgi:hypothetical protein